MAIQLGSKNKVKDLGISRNEIPDGYETKAKFQWKNQSLMDSARGSNNLLSDRKAKNEEPDFLEKMTIKECKRVRLERVNLLESKCAELNISTIMKRSDLYTLHFERAKDTIFMVDEQHRMLFCQACSIYEAYCYLQLLFIEFYAKKITVRD